jgi:hypothetical protein
LNHTDLEFQVFKQLYEDNHKRPTMVQYREAIAGIGPIPQERDLLLKYGSAQAVINDFIESYYKIYEPVRVPDYLLGSFVGRCKLVRRKTGWAHLRYITSDESQIDTVTSFIHNFAVHPVKKDTAIYEMRIHDHDLIMALIKMDFFNESIFIPTVDFVRGYCDGHSALRPYTSTKNHELFRMTISGQLVPQIHDFLVSMGASDTRVIKEGSTLRMHINARSLRRIREKLYPPGCVCNIRKRIMVYRA